jgi:hypothetical protein
MPENPPTSVIVIKLVPLPPCGTDTAAGEAERVNAGAVFTVMLCVTGMAGVHSLSPAWFA